MPAIIDGKKKAQVQVGQKQVEKKTFDCFWHHSVVYKPPGIDRCT